MHAPDGFLNAAASVGTGVVAAGGVGASLRVARDRLDDRRIPLAGLLAAFVFAAQMLNFPIAGGTSGHLLGGALAAILVGPFIGAVVVTVVVVVQALVFADGGLTALGYNIVNMALVTSFGGYGAFLLLRRVLPRRRSGVLVATGIAAGLSVVLSAAAFTLEFAVGGAAPVPLGRLVAAMVGVHTFIGIGEGIISALTVGAVLATRPDLVHGAADLLPRVVLTGAPRAGDQRA